MKNLRWRMVWVFVFAAALPLAAMAWFYLHTFEQTLRDEVLQNLSSIADKKAEQIDSYLLERLNDARVHSKRQRLHEELQAMQKEFARGGLAAVAPLERLYRPDLVALVEFGGFYDLLLIDAKGNVVFTIQHEADFGTNLLHGKWRDSTLAEGFRQSMQSLQVEMTPFATYQPSQQKVASFVVAPLLESGHPIGALALQVNLDALMPVVSDRIGLGHSGETVLAKWQGEEALFTSRLNRIGAAAFSFHTPVETLATPMRHALLGEHGSGLERDYSGTEVAAAWRYLPTLRWGMVVKVDQQEAFEPLRKIRQLTMLTLLLSLLASAALLLGLSRWFARADEELRASETRFERTLASLGEGVFIADLNGICTYANPAALNSLGFSLDEILGKNQHLLFHHHRPDGRHYPIEECPLFLTLADGKLRQQEEWFIRKDGQGFPVIMAVAPIVRGEKRQGVVVSFQDVTVQQRATQALAESVQHTRAILENVVNGILTIDQRGRIASFNRAAENIFGYAAEEIMGQNVGILMPEPHRSQHNDYLENYQRSRIPRVIGAGREVEGRRKDGTLFPMDLSVSEITHNGEPMYIGMVADITERKRIDKMKSEFVATVSHELRTPLTSISGALGLLVGGTLGGLSDQARQLIDIALKNSQRLSHLINDLLDMEKISAGKMAFDCQVQPLLPLVEHGLQSLHGYAERYGIGLRLQADGAESVQVSVDALRLAQVLDNLLSNAIKFSPPGGQVEIVLRPQADSVRLAVVDHGAGIPSEFRSRIFEKFSQADASDTRKKGGTGLGLAISKGIMEQMGGKIGFDSVPGQGATFFIELPLAAPGTGADK